MGSHCHISFEHIIMNNNIISLFRGGNPKNLADRK